MWINKDQIRDSIPYADQCGSIKIRPGIDPVRPACFYFQVSPVRRMKWVATLITLVSITFASPVSEDSDQEILNPLQRTLIKLKELYEKEKDGKLCKDNPVMATECDACHGLSGSMDKSECCRLVQMSTFYTSRMYRLN